MIISYRQIPTMNLKAEYYTFSVEIIDHFLIYDFYFDKI